ncbi:hypothetical protein PGTUg99_004683 [Puccinia graminis f. sp. tritici]|uniref:Uncharacterized protein n=1 Tax=Puccinia graminis f. sp. tritici TaxID=56615 RepID=A0A5B0NAW4_PUCGR|nr:hypothetical protein PGTUg99_004683 [Puccinia graminis f. sp. tritici]
MEHHHLFQQQQINLNLDPHLIKLTYHQHIDQSLLNQQHHKPLTSQQHQHNNQQQQQTISEELLTKEQPETNDFNTETIKLEPQEKTINPSSNHSRSSSQPIDSYFLNLNNHSHSSNSTSTHPSHPPRKSNLNNSAEIIMSSQSARSHPPLELKPGNHSTTDSHFLYEPNFHHQKRGPEEENKNQEELISNNE